MMPVVLRALCLVFGAVLTACGGGGGGAGHTITGVAASGAAIAEGLVEAKCQVGEGSTTTALDGSYSLTIPGRRGPCLLRVTDPLTQTIFHSALEEDATMAVAHITPLSDLVVAHALAKLPAAAFNQPDLPFDKITRARLAEAVAVIRREVYEVGSILRESADDDPLKGALYTATAEARGSLLDQAIDVVMAALAAADMNLSAWAASVAQNALNPTIGGLPKQDGGDLGSPMPPGSVTAILGKAYLNGCPAARIGPVWLFDAVSGLPPVAYEATTIGGEGFGTQTPALVDLTTDELIHISADPADPCAFTAGSRRFRISDNGIGIWHTEDAFGLIVPMQPSVSLASLQGQYGALAMLQADVVPAGGADPARLTQAMALEFALSTSGGPLLRGRHCDTSAAANRACASALADIVLQACESVPQPGGSDNPSGAMRCMNGQSESSSSFIAHLVPYRTGGSATVFLVVEKYLPSTGAVARQGVMVLNKVLAPQALPRVSTIADGAFWELTYEPSASLRDAPMPNSSTAVLVQSPNGLNQGLLGASSLSLLPGSSRSYQQTRGGLTFTHHLDSPTAGLIWSQPSAGGSMLRLASPAGWSFAAEEVTVPEAYRAFGKVHRLSAQIRRRQP